MDWSLAVALLAFVLLLLWARTPRTEPFYGGALPPGTGRQQVLDTGRLAEAVGMAVDRDIPLRPGALTPATFSLGEVRAAMRCGVELVNARCRLDLATLGVDTAEKATDALGTAQYTASVHVYSTRYNASVTLRLVVLTNGGRRYLRSAGTLTAPDDGLGVAAAPDDVFTRQAAKFESLV